MDSPQPHEAQFEPLVVEPHDECAAVKSVTIASNVMPELLSQLTHTKNLESLTILEAPGNFLDQSEHPHCEKQPIVDILKSPKVVVKPIHTHAESIFPVFEITNDTLVVMAQQQQSTVATHGSETGTESARRNVNENKEFSQTAYQGSTGNNDIVPTLPALVVAPQLPQQQQQIDFGWQQRVDVSPVTSAPSPVAVSQEELAIEASNKMSFSMTTILKFGSATLKVGSQHRNS